MAWVLLNITTSKAYSLPPPPPPPALPEYLNSKISPSILLIIVILAVIFFVAGLLHLLIRHVMRSRRSSTEDSDSATAMQSRLQELFQLDDAGVDQSFIDTLPIFLYRAIIGLKDPFDCAVCLCEFEADDKLRLLPTCSHAFHVSCIDTWLLSHSNCPLCRRSLIHGFSPGTAWNPLALVLESRNERSMEIGVDNGGSVISPRSGFLADDEDMGSPAMEDPAAKVVPIKLGKFKSVENSSGDQHGNSSERRCFSMGSFEYVMDEASALQVAIRTPKKKNGIVRPGYRLAMSECDCHSRRDDFKGMYPWMSSEPRADCGHGSDGIGRHLQKRDSYSVSKIWLRSKKEKSAAIGDCPRRASSFRLPLRRGSDDGSEFAIEGLQKSGSSSVLVSDLEAGSCDTSIGSQAEKTPSFATRTLNWIVGSRETA